MVVFVNPERIEAIIAAGAERLAANRKKDEQYRLREEQSEELSRQAEWEKVFAVAGEFVGSDLATFLAADRRKKVCQAQPISLRVPRCVPVALLITRGEGYYEVSDHKHDIPHMYRSNDDLGLFRVRKLEVIWRTNLAVKEYYVGSDGDSVYFNDLGEALAFAREEESRRADLVVEADARTKKEKEFVAQRRRTPSADETLLISLRKFIEETLAERED